MPTPSVPQILETAEREINKAQQFLADLTQVRSDLRNAPRDLYNQAEQFVVSARKDVANASKLQQMLPFAVGIVTALVTGPVVGLAAGGALWYVGQKSS